MALYITLFTTSWLVIASHAAFNPGCSFSDGQCLYNVQLGHQGQCDEPSATVTSGSSSGCSDAIGEQVSGLIYDVSTLKSQVSTLMSELVSSKANVSAVSDQLSEANARTQQLLQTLARKEAELHTTQAELSKVIGQAGEEIRRLTSELDRCKGALGLATNTTTSSPTIGFDRVSLSFCDFEDTGNGSSCGFTSDTGSLAMGFKLGNGTQSADTGPIGDHTFGGSPQGHYMFIDTLQIAENNPSRELHRVSLTSPQYPPGPGYCVRLWYNMYGRDVQDFDVYVKINSQIGYPVIHNSGDQSQRWVLAEADLDSEFTSRPFQIVISATTSAYHDGWHTAYKDKGEIAVDDISVYSTRCKNVPLCPSNSIKRSSDGQTYCYTFHTLPATWYQAASLCRQEGARSSLVTVTSQEEQDFLVRTIKADAVLSMAGQAGFYTAGNDERKEHTFEWTDTGTPYLGQYTNWKDGQPNNVAGDQDCLLLQYPQLNYQWGDVDCDERHPFICKTVVSGSPQLSTTSSPLIG